MKIIRSVTYENKLLVLLSFIFGFVLFDRIALSFLVPFFDKELRLNNTHIGLLSSCLALAWATSGYIMGTLSDRTGKRKQYLLLAVVTFSICSFVSGLAASFAFLLLARMLMGLAEGPVLPLAQSILIDASTEKRRGFNMGFMQSFVSNVLAMLAPVTLVSIAINFGWRNAFFIAGIPGLILAVLGFFYIKERKTPIIEKEQKASIAHLFQYRNVWVTIVLSCCMMTWLSAQITFMPKYLISIKRFSPEDMAKTMSVFALAVMIWGLVIPALSDKFGRKPVVIIFSFLSVLMPLGVVYSGNNYLGLLLTLVLGSSIMGCFPIVLATIPSETIPRRNIAQTLGLVMGAGELVGGFAAPATAGWSADHIGLHTPFLIAAGAAVAASLIAFLLFETAPALLKKSGNDVNPFTDQGGSRP
jgi:MFS family permease